MRFFKGLINGLLVSAALWVLIIVVITRLGSVSNLGDNEREDTRLVIRPSTEPYDNKYYDKGY